MEMAIPHRVIPMAKIDFRERVSFSIIHPAIAAIGGASVIISWPKRGPIYR